METRVLVTDVREKESLQEAFTQALQRLPGLLPQTIPPSVVIKPNLCDAVSWETGVTTDPEWLPVLAQELRRRRPDVDIRVVESDAVSAYKAIRSGDEAFDRLGYREAAVQAGVNLVNLSREPSWEVEIDGLPTPICIPELLLEDFFFISLANVKVHPYERFTGTLKNLFGLLPQQDKSSHHMQLPHALCALYRLCSPDLAILDGRIGLEGKGPILGEVKRLGKLIMGTSGLAVDETACRLIGCPPREVPHLRFTARAVGHDPKTVQVLGNIDPVPFAFDPEGVHKVIVAKFRVRRFHRALEQFSLRATGRWFRAKKNPWRFAKDVCRRLTRRKQNAS